MHRARLTLLPSMRVMALGAAAYTLTDPSTTSKSFSSVPQFDKSAAEKVGSGGRFSWTCIFALNRRATWAECQHKQ